MTLRGTSSCLAKATARRICPVTLGSCQTCGSVFVPRHTPSAGSSPTTQSRKPAFPRLYSSAARAISSRKLGAVVLVMAVFLASMSAAHRAAPTVLVKEKKMPTKGTISKRVATVPKLCHGLLALACDLGGMHHLRGVRSNVLLEPGRLLRLGPALQLEVLDNIISH